MNNSIRYRHRSLCGCSIGTVCRCKALPGARLLQHRRWRREHRTSPSVRLTLTCNCIERNHQGLMRKSGACTPRTPFGMCSAPRECELWKRPCSPGTRGECERQHLSANGAAVVSTTTCLIR
jgi:hypothetical protein